MNSRMANIKEKLRQIPSLEAPLPDFDYDMFPKTPHEGFAVWLEEALKAGIREPHAMTLSTCDENGCPDARMLILKNVDERGWHFAIKAESPKGQQIVTQPNVALTFYWSSLGRQIRLRGPAILLSAEECAADFLERPHGSRINALASRQSAVLSNTSELNKRLDEAKAFFIVNPDYIAPDWQVYAVAPTVVEFWQGASDRNHKRLRFTLASGQNVWERVHLWP